MKLIKMKLTEQEKRIRKAYLKELFTGHGEIFNGTSHVWCWFPQFPGANMGFFGMSKCNSRDKFSRKYGEYLALIRVFEAVDLFDSPNMDRDTWIAIQAGCY